MSSQLQDIVNARNGGYSAATEYENAEAWAKKYADATTAKYAAGIQNLNDQKARLGVEYDPYRAAANAQYERNVRTNNEQMANLGLNRSGTNITNQIKLSTERQRNLAQVDANQAKAEQEIKAQINEYIAQRDSQIMEGYARAYETAANNVSSFQRSSALAEQQFGYDQKLAELDYAHDKEMAALNHEYTIAEMNNDYAKKAQLEREMAALDYSYSMQKIERQAQLDNESYAQRAATDWNYTQQQMALEDKYAQAQYNSRAATDWDYAQKQAALENQYAQSLYGYKAATDYKYSQKKDTTKLTGKTISNVDGLGETAKALYSKHNTTMQRANASSNSTVRKSNGASAFADIEREFNNGTISETEAAWLINLWRLN